jgi:hypothetical protein
LKHWPRALTEHVGPSWLERKVNKWLKDEPDYHLGLPVTRQTIMLALRDVRKANADPREL